MDGLRLQHLPLRRHRSTLLMRSVRLLLQSPALLRQHLLHQHLPPARRQVPLQQFPTIAPGRRSLRFPLQLQNLPCIYCVLLSPLASCCISTNFMLPLPHFSRFCPGRLEASAASFKELAFTRGAHASGFGSQNASDDPECGQPKAVIWRQFIFYSLVCKNLVYMILIDRFSSIRSDRRIIVVRGLGFSE